MMLRAANAQRRYSPAQVEGAEGAYGVYFPDLPGCASTDETIAEALAGSKEALALHVAGMGEDGNDIPRPSDAVLLEGSIAVAMVAATMPGKKKVNVVIDEGLLAAIDALEQNRSAFLERAARHELAETV